MSKIDNKIDKLDLICKLKRDRDILNQNQKYITNYIQGLSKNLDENNRVFINTDPYGRTGHPINLKNCDIIRILERASEINCQRMRELDLQIEEALGL